MIIIGGSFAVSDIWKYGGPKDLDVIYLTWNPGLYVLLVKYKSQLEVSLSEKFGIEVSFSPFLFFSPKLIGNLFLALVFDRTNFSSPLNKLAKAFIPKRWLLLYSVYAFLGLYSAESLRDCVKYGAMFAENLVLYKGLYLPKSWFKTVILGYMISQELNLLAHSDLFLSLVRSIKECTVNLDIMRQLAVKVFIENLSLFKIQVDKLDRALIRLGVLDEPFRTLHEMMYKFISKRIVRWRLSVRILANLAKYVVATRGKARPDVISKVFNLYKLQIPVLSPLAYP